MGRGEGQDGNADLCSRTGARYMSMTSFGLRGLTGLYHQHAGSRRTYESRALSAANINISYTSTSHSLLLPQIRSLENDSSSISLSQQDTMVLIAKQWRD